MNHEHDPIDDLRALWQRVEAPEPEADDAATRAAVTWMRRAWNELEAPPVEVPFALRRRRVVRTVAAFAAAAALLAGVLVGLAALLDRPALEPSGTGPRELAHGPSSIGESPSVAEPPHTAPKRTDCEVDERGRVVMRRGTVTLVWLGADELTRTEPRADDEHGAESLGAATASDGASEPDTQDSDSIRAENQR